jgi:micrococcal nuclease
VAVVLDGDTVVLADGRHVRLIGVNTPELGHGEGPDEPLAVKAKQLLTQLVAGKPVRLGYGPERYDRHGRTLARLTRADGTDVQTRLLKKGLAAAIAIPPDLGHLRRNLAAEADARARGAGIWSNPYFRPREARSLTDADTGFRFVTGTVEHIGTSRKYIYLDMAKGFSLRVSRAEWAQYFRGAPNDWLGARVTARGWISRHGRWLHLGLHHPAMVTRHPE